MSKWEKPLITAAELAWLALVQDEKDRQAWSDELERLELPRHEEEYAIREDLDT